MEDRKLYLNDLMAFATAKNMLDRPVSEVIPLFDKELKEYFEDSEADRIIDEMKSSPEIYY